MTAPPPSTDDDRRDRLARLAGGLYLLTMALALFSEGFVRARLLDGDSAARTVAHLTSHNLLYRASIAADLLTFCGVLVLVWSLYHLLRPVQRELAALAAGFRLVELAVHISALAFGVAAMSLLARGEYTQAFSEPQLSGLVGLALRAQGAGLMLGFIPLGLGSATFAWLFLRSGLVPRWLATWGIVASLLLAAYAFAVVLFPSARDLFFLGTAPMFIYEVSVGAWLLVRGARVQAVTAS